MMQPFRSTLPTEKTAAQGEIVLRKNFDYTSLDTAIVQQVQTEAQRIRQLVQRTLEDLIAVGNSLLAVKHTLPHGSFGPWLRAEFGWTERTARNFMTVAQRFGPKTEIISDLQIEPTAAYLLAAPSVPEEASMAALRRAEDGERITISVAKEILGSFRRKPRRRERTTPVEWPTEKLLGQVLELLESLRQRWGSRRMAALARQLRDFADSLEET